MRFCAALLAVLTALTATACGVTEPAHGGHYSAVEIGVLRTQSILTWLEADIVPIAQRRAAGTAPDARETGLLGDAQAEYARAVRLVAAAESDFVDLEAAAEMEPEARRPALRQQADDLMVQLHETIFRMRGVAEATGWAGLPSEPDPG